MPTVLTECDLSYYRSRMAAELALAASTGHSDVTRAHRDLAAKYDRLISSTAPESDYLSDLPPGVPAPRPAIHAG